jgi:N4-(beta-N-acetylglucosaminyl)-L-asparaginase
LLSRRKTNRSQKIKPGNASLVRSTPGVSRFSPLAFFNGVEEFERSDREVSTGTSLKTGGTIMKSMNRREFVLTGAAASLAMAAPKSMAASGPNISSQRKIKPAVIASANSNKYKNGGDLTCLQRAFQMITEGADVLEALIAGVNILELDPEESSVGYGGLPNANGIVQLDASCMHGPRKRAGAVAALEGVRTPSLVAKAVMETTDHHLIVGADAQQFARSMGFKIEPDLNTERSRTLWLEWKRRLDPEHYLDPKTRAEHGYRTGAQMVAEGLVDPEHFYGTVNCNGIGLKGEICGVTSTSGLAWKIPGRVGDSPILGAGLYVDGAVGAAGSTGRGEANLYNLSSFFIVECMRQGRSPKDAGLEACRRIRANTIEKRLLNSRGLPNFGLNFYIINAQGDFAGVSLYELRSPDVFAPNPGKTTFAICTEDGPHTVPCEALLPGSPSDA